MKYTFFLFIIITFFISCNEPKSEKHLIEDRKVQKYLREYIDLQEEKNIEYNPYSFQLLKAFHEEDSIFIDKFIEQSRKYNNQEELMDSLYYWLEIPVSIKELDENIEVAFRFNYWRAFGYNLFITTIKSSKEKYWIESFFLS
jgi:hypothetical protein